MEKKESEEIRGLNDLYKELSELLGYANMQKIYMQYKGVQISFPTRLYNKDYVREVVKQEFDGANTQDLARRYGYTERWIRTIATEECKEDTEV